MPDFEALASAFRTISKQTDYTGLASALLDAALAQSGTVRGAVLLNGEAELLAKADAVFPRERAEAFASRPFIEELYLPSKLRHQVLEQQSVVVEAAPREDSMFRDSLEQTKCAQICFLCLPVVRYGRTIGVLYLEADLKTAVFSSKCITTISMLAAQAAGEFESAQLFDALRETNMWMVQGQQIGRMGSYRWNTRTLNSRASRECLRIVGIDPSVNPVPFEAFRDRIHPDDLPSLERALEEALHTQASYRHEYRVVHKDGTTLHVVAVGEFDRGPTGDLELQGIITDITERKAAEQALADAQMELARAARLTSLGELAGAIIHEVNQPVTGIIASAEAALRWLDRTPAGLEQARESLQRVINQGLRASNVVSGLRTLVRDGRLQLAEISLHETIEEVLVVLRRDFQRSAICLVRDFDPSAIDLEADRVQVQQVVLNLVRNAIDAMSEISSGARTLTMTSKRLDSCTISVTVADTGTGISKDAYSNLFAPLFTTKEGGLGLGLSICRKIITAHHGELRVEEGKAQGAAFSFTLPLRQPVLAEGD